MQVSHHAYQAQAAIAASGTIPDQGQAARTDQLSPVVHQKYRDANLAVTPDTFPAVTDADLLAAPRWFREGTFNCVWSVQVKDKSGSPSEWVFKPLKLKEDAPDSWVGLHIGIPKDNPQTVMRNIATAAYAQRLGFDVIVETKVALLTLPGAEPAPENAELGLLMRRATGFQARDMISITLSIPEVIKEITKLQLLDHLTGEGDRNSSNYFVHPVSRSEVKVIGIDNDQCFGQLATPPEGVARGDGLPQRGSHGMHLPPVVDKAMALSINGLQPADLHAMLGDKLGQSEIDAAIQRLASVQAHLAHLESQQRIIDPSEWGSEMVQGLLTPSNSYAQREIAASKRRLGHRS